MDIVEEVKQKLKNKITTFYEKNKRRYYIEINPKDVIETSKILFSDLTCRLVTATGIDTPNGFEIIYHFSHDKTGTIFSIRTLIKDKTNPEIDSITPIIKGAEWIEREIYEMLGIKFKGHPNLKRLLLAPDFPENVYPLRQSS